jgi:hypothetical protein
MKWQAVKQITRMDKPLMVTYQLEVVFVNE